MRGRRVARRRHALVADVAGVARADHDDGAAAVLRFWSRAPVSWTKVSSGFQSSPKVLVVGCAKKSDYPRSSDPEQAGDRVESQTLLA